MPLHYLDPTREPRECDAGPPYYHPLGCLCKGTGRLGEEGAEPDVETEWVDYGDATDVDSEGREYSLTGWYVGPPGLGASGGPFPTDAAALAAARKRPVNCECDNTHSQNATCCMPCWDAGFRTVAREES